MNIPPKVETLPPEKQSRLDQLLDMNNEGTISLKEKAELDRLVIEAEQLMVENAKRFARFAENESPAAPPSAMPVTVWVKPSSPSN